MKNLFLAVLITTATSFGAIVTYVNDLAGFNAAAGNPPIAISFDSLSGDLAGTTISGVTFSSPDGNTLEAVAGVDTLLNQALYTGTLNPMIDYKLIPTSGRNVLSPGGTDLAPGPSLKQRDSLKLAFVTPLKFFGLDVLFPSYDSTPFLQVTVFDSGNNVLLTESFPVPGAGGAGSGPASVFYGLASTNFDIASIIFTETDDNNDNPDANIGFDTFRYTAIPEPGAGLLVVAGLGVIALLRRR